MIPSVNDRLASVVRALTDVILPSIPADAGLAQEQMQLVIGHIQILQAQLDGSLGFEAEEAADARVLGDSLLKASDGGPKVHSAQSALERALSAQASDRDTRISIHAAIDELVKACAADGTSAFQSALGPMIVAHQTPRTMKDRQWFTMMGFDSGM